MLRKGMRRASTYIDCAMLGIKGVRLQAKLASQVQFDVSLKHQLVFTSRIHPFFLHLRDRVEGHVAHAHHGDAGGRVVHQHHVLDRVVHDDGREPDDLLFLATYNILFLIFTS